MRTFTQFLTEGTTITPSQEPGTMTFWHGGNLDHGPPAKGRSGRIEYGPGLYLTTHYGTARQYAKGARKLYQVVIRKGTDLADVRVSPEAVRALVQQVATPATRAEILQRLSRYTPDVPASAVLNHLINIDAVKPARQEALRGWLVAQGIDYTLVDHAFGWHERMAVVFNPRVIVSQRRVQPTDTIDPFDLPTTFVSGV